MNEPQQRKDSQKTQKWKSTNRVNSCRCNFPLHYATDSYILSFLSFYSRFFVSSFLRCLNREISTAQSHISLMGCACLVRPGVDVWAVLMPVLPSWLLPSLLSSVSVSQSIRATCCSTLTHPLSIWPRLPSTFYFLIL